MKHKLYFELNLESRNSYPKNLKSEMLLINYDNSNQTLHKSISKFVSKSNLRVARYPSNPYNPSKKQNSYPHDQNHNKLVNGTVPPVSMSRLNHLSIPHQKVQVKHFGKNKLFLSLQTKTKDVYISRIKRLIQSRQATSSGFK